MLPRSLTPMQPVLKGEPFDSPNHIFQVKWDGIRLLSFVEAGKVRLQNRRLRDRSDAYPELLTLPQMLRADGILLDGEVIVLGPKGPSFPAVLRREQVTTKRRAALLAQEVPICYMVFDLLFVGGQSLLDQPLVERQQRLREVLTADSLVHIVDNFPSGRTLFAAVKKAALEGIVAKKKNSSYVPGTKTKAWQKIKVRRQQLCVVGGYLSAGPKLRSLLVGAWLEEQLLYLGRVGTGLTTEESTLLEKTLPRLVAPTCPFAPGQQVPAAQWTYPVLPVAVEFSEWTEELHLRAPSIVGFPQVEAADCRLER